ncbi:hypothetical protein KUV57_13055 [Epibacterium sp. DP7N7-1]|nr:hypothetical protein [Epibacterium sp. DP7N7-1]
MKTALEKTVEILSGEEGVSIVVRPLFPFIAEGYRVRGTAELEVFGDGKRISLAVPEDVQGDVAASEQLSLCEFPMEGSEVVRELILSRSRERVYP